MKPVRLRDLRGLPKHDPTALYRLRDGLYAPDLVAAAVTGLDFFTWLAKSPASAPAICESLGLAARPADVMLALFRAMGLLEKKGETFRVTGLARDILTRESPWFIGPYYAPLAERPVCRELLEVLRTGKPAQWAHKAQRPWTEAMQDAEVSEKFARMMDARGLYLGPILARRTEFRGRRHVLDIAGATGIYACCLVAAHRGLRATVLERAPVDRVARRCIAQRGCSDRVAVAEGDMFAAPFPAACDVHLFSNVLHDWDEASVQTLLRKSHSALPRGGLVVIHDAHLNRSKTGPLPVAAHAVFLMAVTQGRYYSVSEIGDFLRAAGFSGMRFARGGMDYSVITARKR